MLVFLPINYPDVVYRIPIPTDYSVIYTPDEFGNLPSTYFVPQEFRFIELHRTRFEVMGRVIYSDGEKSLNNFLHHYLSKYYLHTYYYSSRTSSPNSLYNSSWKRSIALS